MAFSDKKTVNNLIIKAVIILAALLVMTYLERDMSQKRADSIVGKLTQGRAHVIGMFPGPSGLQGIIMTGDAGPIVGWITQNGSAVIVGGVINTKTNNNETDAAASKYLGRTGGSDALAAQTANVTPAATPVAVEPVTTEHPPTAKPGQDALTAELNKFLAQASNFKGVDQLGFKDNHILYVFFDPNCIYCNKLFNDFQAMAPKFASMGVGVRYVPVAILKQSSVGRAANIVAHGWDALAQNERGFNAATEDGGSSEFLTGQDAANAIAAVRVNSQELAAIGAATADGKAGTPTLVWRASNGTPYFMGGYPDASTMEKIFATIK